MSQDRLTRDAVRAAVDATVQDIERYAQIVIPVRSFTDAKARLSSRLSPDERAALACRLAAQVARAAEPHHVIVVSAAPEVERWARDAGYTTCADPGTLDAAAAAGCDVARSAGARRIVVAHADLPFVTTFESVLGEGEEVVLVADRHGDGTPVLSIPSDCAFRFAYGPGSFARHVEETQRLGLPVRVVDDPVLAFDIDVPADLDAAAAHLAARA
jgi:2-phospho-L-lactate guanylyltransferase